MLSRRRLLIAGMAALGSGVAARASIAERKARRVAIIDMRRADESAQFVQSIATVIREQLGRDADSIVWSAIHAPHGELLGARIADLLNSSPDIVIAVSARAATSLRKLSPHVAMVFSTQEDPTLSGLVQNLVTPGMHATGLWNDLDLHCKRLDLLQRALPSVREVAVVVDARDAKRRMVRTAYAECQLPGVRTQFVEVDGEEELRRITKKIPRGTSGLVIPHSDLCSQWPDLIVEQVNRLGLPAIFDGQWLVERGGLMSLEPVELDEARTLAAMAARILRGTEPGTIPIERPRTTRVSLNIATAGRQGIRLPNWLLTTADSISR